MEVLRPRAIARIIGRCRLARQAGCGPSTWQDAPVGERARGGELEVEVEVVDEQVLGVADRRSAGELLAEVFEYAGYRGDGHRGAVPEFRVLIRDRLGRMVGHRSAFRLANDRDLVAYGLGDAAVPALARGQGIATRLVDVGIQEARRRGAQAILTYTEPLAGLYRRRGFVAAGGCIAGDLPEYAQSALLWTAQGVTRPTTTNPLYVLPADF